MITLDLDKCEICGSISMLQIHHRLSKSKWAIKLYPDYIHDKRNLQVVCANCHIGHASANLVHWSEAEFCRAMGIEPRSKLLTRVKS